MPEVHAYTGAQVAAHLDAVAALRIEVFRDWPYLYEGDHAYEANYLVTYAKSPESLFVLAFDQGRVVGASTGIPLVDETPSFQQPFRERGIALERVFYFGESVLLPPYRGQGLGHRFFDERERYARRLGRFDTTAFCAVVRDGDDPRRPLDHRSNELFWSKRGYQRQHDMLCEIEWREIGETRSRPHVLCFWMHALERQ